MTSVYVEMPNKLFEADAKDARGMLLDLICENILTGNNEWLIDGAVYRLNDFNLNSGPMFKVPRAILHMFYYEECIDLEQFLLLTYFCYTANKLKTSEFKITLNVAVKRTGISKTKFREALKRISEDDGLCPFMLEVDGLRINMRAVNADFIEVFDGLESELNDDEEGIEIPIPKIIVRGYSKLGITPEESMITCNFLAEGVVGGDYREIMNRLINIFSITEDEILNAVNSVKEKTGTFMYEIEDGQLDVWYID